MKLTKYFNKKYPKTQIRVRGKWVGYVQRGTFYKTVKGSAHFMRIVPSVGFDDSSIQDAIDAGATKLEVTDKETKCRYAITIKEYAKRAFRLPDFGHGLQSAVEFKWWTKTKL